MAYSIKCSLVLVAVLFTLGMPAQNITGQWYGLLEIPVAPMPFNLAITQTGTGYSATIDSPEQKVAGMPVENLIFNKDSLSFTIAAAGITYAGLLAADQIIRGEFRQQNFSVKLDFKREGILVKSLNRPQEPQKPYPYVSQEIAFRNEKASITLAGTLTMPRGKGKFPAVVLISGSGAQDRNETVMGHKPFLVIADYLTRHGIAVLRFDDRGTAASQGNFATAGLSDFASDVESALLYLRKRKEVDTLRIGLLGHSEGGIVGPMVAAKKGNEVAFLVLMAAPGLPGDQLLLKQSYDVGKAAGMTEANLKRAEVLNKGIYALVRQEVDSTSLTKKLNDYLNKEIKNQYNPGQIKDWEIQQFVAKTIADVTSSTVIEALRCNPQDNIVLLKCPVLALYGEKDIQVAAEGNLQAIEIALKKGENKDFKALSFEGLNHLFQQCKKGTIEEYKQIEQTISPAVLEEVKVWILEHAQ